MAETADAKQQSETVQGQAPNLKYLEFVQVVSLYAIVLLSRIYNFAKENSGPLKGGVQTVEGTVKTVVGPVYEKFQDTPFQLLKYADRKVDGLVHEIDRHVPTAAREVSSQAFSAAHKVQDLARSVSSEAECVGVVDTAVSVAKAGYAKIQPTVKDAYVRYEPVAERYAVSAWRSVNRIPIFAEVAHIVVPTVAHWSDKYNRGVMCIADKGYTVSAYMPLVPTERIAKVFGGDSASPSSEPVPATSE